MDVGDEGDVKRLNQTALAEFGKVDVVLNNATIFPMGPEKDPKKLDANLKVIDSWIEDISALLRTLKR
jgi:NAD(P)-dependent dehydrogenase (short-subunit alcohol dehydrogenase family)